MSGAGAGLQWRKYLALRRLAELHYKPIGIANHTAPEEPDV